MSHTSTQTEIGTDTTSPKPRPAEDSPSGLTTIYRTISVDGLKVFYREAGDPKAPAVLLLHGFPTSSHMYRELIPALADRWRWHTGQASPMGGAEVQANTILEERVNDSLEPRDPL